MTLFKNGKRVATIRLEKRVDGQWHMFGCSDCHLDVFRHNGDLVAETPGMAPLELGIEIPCRNKNCGKVYVIEGFATKV